MTIRQARPSDATVIAEFNKRLALETEDLELEPNCIEPGVAAVLRDPAKGVYYVAERNGQVVGQVMITYEWSDWRNGNLWWIQSVYVDEKHRRLGIFSRLFEHLRTLAAQSADAVGLRLYMQENNARARQSYERLGMKRTGYEVFELDVQRES
ncbi:MAG: GNAT family N-acetyltransferase [Verrucomicrobia bacterium]|nr:MAG: GNAT family N-acetyltransferase [Verrucomicrobiota bacterium]